MKMRTTLLGTLAATTLLLGACGGGSDDDAGSGGDSGSGGDNEVVSTLPDVDDIDVSDVVDSGDDAEDEAPAEPVNLCTSLPMDDVVAAVESYDDDDDMQPFEMLTDEADRCTLGNTPYGNWEVSLSVGSSSSQCDNVAAVEDWAVVDDLGDGNACLKQNFVYFVVGDVDYVMSLDGAHWFMYGDDGTETEEARALVEELARVAEANLG